MARTFDGVDDVISMSITAVTGVDWTIAAWVKPNNGGEGNVGQIFRTDPGTANDRQQFRLTGASMALNCRQRTDATFPDSTSTNTLTAGVWVSVFGTLRVSDMKIRMYIGSLVSPVAEVSYSSQITGTGSALTNGTVGRIGNNQATTATFDGVIGPVSFAAREWTLDEMEAFRLGARPVNAGMMRGFWPLDSPDAAQAEDLSGNGANGTVVGCTVAENPPIPFYPQSQVFV